MGDDWFLIVKKTIIYESMKVNIMIKPARRRKITTLRKRMKSPIRIGLAFRTTGECLAVESIIY